MSFFQKANKAAQRARESYEPRDETRTRYYISIEVMLMIFS